MSKRIPTLDEFINESILNEMYNEFNDLMSIDIETRLVESLLSPKSIVLDEFQKDVLNVIHENNGFHDLLVGELSESVVLNWCTSINEEGTSIASKWKDKVASAIETMKDKGKSALSTTQEALLKIGQDISGLVKVVVSSITEFIKKAWTWMYNRAEEKYAPIKEKIIESAKAKIDKHGVDKTSEEIKNLSSMCKHTIKYFTGEFSKTAAAGIADASKANESIEILIEKSVFVAVTEMISEGVNVLDAINESDGHKTVHLPFLSSLSKKLSKFPPFTWMHHAESFVAKNANNALEKLSEMLTKFIGAPGPFEFVFMGALVGIVAGYMIEHEVANIIKHVGESAIGASIVVLVPGIGWILGILAKISMGLFLVACAETAVHAVAAAKK